MFEKLLIADRGAGALRIMRSARELGVRTVAVYSTDDADTTPVAYVDEAVWIGPAQVEKSYRAASKIIDAAKSVGADAIHPGFDFLAEDALFARACADAGITFVGPSAECIERMGHRAMARDMIKACGIPVVAGSDGVVCNLEAARDAAQRLGYPVVIKAVGGPSMRKVRSSAEMDLAYDAARQEAGELFGADGVYIEKYLSAPRYIDVQVLADDFGNRVALCERDSSVRRGGQAPLAEAPSPALTDDLRRAMRVAAVKAVRALDYRGAGTLEFLLMPDGHFQFVSMRTCLGLDHPVTEQITGTDIVKEQLRIAAGEPMSCAERAPFTPFGHAMEFFICAEDSDAGFAPCPGTIERFEVPTGPGVRVETHLQAGARVSVQCDTHLATLVVFGQDRAEVIARSKRALDEFIIEGVRSTIPFHRRVLDNEVFCAGEATANFIETQMGDCVQMSR